MWTFVLNKVDFREAPVQELVKVDKVKVVACDGKSVWEEWWVLLSLNFVAIGRSAADSDFFFQNIQIFALEKWH